jgi:hypothetical protein
MRHLLTIPSRIAAALFVAALVVPVPAQAGGPLAVCRPGEPYRWPNGGTNIPWNPDQGTLGPLSNAQAVAFVAQSFGRWDAVASASTTYLQGAALPEDVTGATRIAAELLV